MQINDELFNEIRKLSNLTTRYIRKTQALQTKGELTRAQSIILIYIHENQKEGDNIYQKDIEEHFMIRRSTATEILKKLEKMSYIKRTQSQIDARLKDLILTEKSLKFISSANKNVKSFGDIVGKSLTDQEKTTLKNIIQKMKTNIIRELNNEKNS